MANSLQDQLLKAGLIDKQKANKAKKAKQRKKKEQRHTGRNQEDETTQLAKQASAQRAVRDRELNRIKNAERKQKEIGAQIRQLFELNQLPLDEGDIAYHFSDSGIIQRIYVTENMPSKLSRGQLCIVKLDQQYAVVPVDVAEKIRQRDETCVIVCNETEQADDADDPYADFKVPDDLMW